MSRELGRRSVVGCGSTRLLGGVPVRRTGHPGIVDMLPQRVGVEELGQWASRFAPHEPTRPQFLEGQRISGHWYCRWEEVEKETGSSWRLGDRSGSSAVALQELWEMKLDEQG